VAQKIPLLAKFTPGATASFLAFFWICTVQSLPALCQKRNPYHLPLTTRAGQYKAQTDSQPGLQMVRLKNLLPDLRTDWRYATKQNFTGEILYQNPDAYLRKEAADQLKMVDDSLKKMGLGLLIFDAYRPYRVTLAMWKIVPDDRYAANPANGSGHNRGIAVDLTLVNRSIGAPLPMPTDFDNFTDSAHHDFQTLDTIVLQNRTLLKGVMEYFGFRALSTEWWHYALPEPRRYPLMDIRFRKMKKWTKEK
jgi:D-alanyl-D-alanine dipeptidase